MNYKTLLICGIIATVASKSEPLHLVKEHIHTPLHPTVAASVTSPQYLTKNYVPLPRQSTSTHIVLPLHPSHPLPKHAQTLLVSHYDSPSQIIHTIQSGQASNAHSGQLLNPGHHISSTPLILPNAHHTLQSEPARHKVEQNVNHGYISSQASKDVNGGQIILKDNKQRLNAAVRQNQFYRISQPVQPRTQQVHQPVQQLNQKVATVAVEPTVQSPVVHGRLSYQQTAIQPVAVHRPILQKSLVQNPQTFVAVPSSHQQAYHSTSPLHSQPGCYNHYGQVVPCRI